MKSKKWFPLHSSLIWDLPQNPHLLLCSRRSPAAEWRKLTAGEGNRPKWFVILPLGFVASLICGLLERNRAKTAPTNLGSPGSSRKDNNKLKENLYAETTPLSSLSLSLSVCVCLFKETSNDTLWILVDSNTQPVWVCLARKLPQGRTTQWSVCLQMKIGRSTSTSQMELFMSFHNNL